jgi:hypothetical protein
MPAKTATAGNKIRDKRIVLILLATLLHANRRHAPDWRVMTSIPGTNNWIAAIIAKSVNFDRARLKVWSRSFDHFDRLIRSPSPHADRM